MFGPAKVNNGGREGETGEEQSGWGCGEETGFHVDTPSLRDLPDNQLEMPHGRQEERLESQGEAQAGGVKVGNVST